MGSSTSVEEIDSSTTWGTALIFSHRYFTKEYGTEKIVPCERHGTEHDHTNLSKSLRKYYNLNVEVYTDNKEEKKYLTTAYVKSKIDEYSKKTYSPDHTKCFVVVVLSHGKNGGRICSHDSEYLGSDIWEPLINCKALKGIPKIFLFQACRGATPEFIVTKDESVTIMDDPEYQFLILPNDPHVFIGYSTTEHYTAWRNTESGTWFIKTITNNLNSLNKPEGLQEFMTRVIREVVELRKPEEILFQVSKLPEVRANEPGGSQDEHITEDIQGSNAVQIHCDAQGYIAQEEPEENQSSGEIGTIAQVPLTVRLDTTKGQTSCFVSKMIQPFIIKKAIDVISPEISHGHSSKSTLPAEQSTEVQNKNVHTNKKIKFASEETKYYDREKNTRGFAILFYTKPYLYSAQRMEMYLKFMQFDIKLIEINNNDSIENHLQRAQKNEALTSTPYLVIALFAPVRYIKIGAVEECYVEIGKASYKIPIRNTLERNFLASKCNMLQNKPKLFFIIDGKCEKDITFIKSSENGDVEMNESSNISIENKKEGKDVTNHADMLFVHGSGQGFILHLCRELRISVHKKENIFTALREAMKQSYSDEILNELDCPKTVAGTSEEFKLLQQTLEESRSQNIDASDESESRNLDPVEEEMETEAALKAENKKGILQKTSDRPLNHHYESTLTKLLKFETCKELNHLPEDKKKQIILIRHLKEQNNKRIKQCKQNNRKLKNNEKLKVELKNLLIAENEEVIKDARRENKKLTDMNSFLTKIVVKNLQVTEKTSFNKVRLLILEVLQKLFAIKKRHIIRVEQKRLRNKSKQMIPPKSDDNRKIEEILDPSRLSSESSISTSMLTSVREQFPGTSISNEPESKMIPTNVIIVTLKSQYLCEKILESYEKYELPLEHGDPASNITIEPFKTRNLQ